MKIVMLIALDDNTWESATLNVPPDLAGQWRVQEIDTAEIGEWAARQLEAQPRAPRFVVLTAVLRLLLA